MWLLDTHPLSVVTIKANRFQPPVEQLDTLPLPAIVTETVRRPLAWWFLVLVAIAWLAGLAFANWFGLTILLPVIGGAGLLLLARWWRAAHRRTLALLLIIVALAGWRFLWASDPGDPWNIATWSARMPVTVRGVVATEPEFYGSREKAFLVAIAGVERSDGWHRATGKALVVYPDDGYTTVAYGDDVSIQGTVERPGQTPSGQAMSLWLPPGTGARLSRPQITVLDHNGGNPVFAWLFALRRRLATSMTAALPQPDAAVLAGIVLGLKTPVLRQLQPAFQTTGTIHLVVTSGLKLSILAALLEALLRPFLSRRRALPLILLGVFVATVLGGAGPAAIRAGIMAALLVLAPEVGHRSYRYTALAAAALIMTVLDPFLLWDVGFQLSFLGALGIALLGPPLTTLLGHMLRFIPGASFLAEELAVTIAAEIATLPVMAASFGMLSIVAPLANLCVLPLVPPLLVLGLMVGGAGLVSAPLAFGIGWICQPLLALLVAVVQIGATLPGAALTIGALAPSLVTLYYGVLGLMIVFFSRARLSGHHVMTGHSWEQQRRYRRWQRLALAVALIVCMAGPAWAARPDSALYLDFLKIGAGGSAILLHAPNGRLVLIDGGADPIALGEDLGTRIPFWRRTLDLAVLTDPQPGRAIGLLAAMMHYQFAQAADAGMVHPNTTYIAWRRALRNDHIPYTRLLAGMVVTVAPNLTITALAPGLPLAEGSPERNALILRLDTPALHVLFLGDADAAELRDLLASGVDLHADIVAVALPDQALASAHELLTAVVIASNARTVVLLPSAVPVHSRKGIVAPPPLPAALWQVPPGVQIVDVRVSGEWEIRRS
jgi:competence protein ComEC